jgi:hypothetical protein
MTARRAVPYEGPENQDIAPVRAASGVVGDTFSGADALGAGLSAILHRNAVGARFCACEKQL